MLSLLEGRLRFWKPRLHFGVLLLIFGELVAWQNASHYRIQDWLALLVIYLALAAILLDVIVRLQVNEWKTLLLVGGLFGLMQGTLISLAVIDLEDLSIDLIFRPLGVEVLMFGLALLSFHLLSSGEATGLWAFLLAALVGLGWGIWTRWFPAAAEINQTSPTFSESLPYAVIGLVLGAILPLLIHPPYVMETVDWLLTPYEWAAAGGVLLITLLVRVQYLNSIGLSLVVVLLSMILFMLYFTRNARQGSFLDAITPAKTPMVVGWLILLIPFTLLAYLGYNLPDSADVPGYANALFVALTIFGVTWVPLVSILMGISTMIQLTREGY